MNPDSTSPGLDDDSSESLDAEAGRVFDAYLASLEADQAISPEDLLAAHPELADRLRECLDVLHWTNRLADRTEVPVDVLLGDFRIIRLIGQGGMGVVYEAEQVSLGRRVALKVMHPGGALDPRQLRRFQLEAQAVASLHHTNIVPIHAVGCDRGIPYYAMQLIDGRSLADVISEMRRDARPIGSVTAIEDALTTTIAGEMKSGRFVVLPLEKSKQKGPASDAFLAPTTRGRNHARNVAALGLQAAEALEHAHTRGVLHRDIKPANLLVDLEGRLWITDFGLARLPVDQGLTCTGDLLGTLRYMSPEQAQGQRVLLDGRTDIYSLGITLYELLTLRAAIEGDNRQDLLRQIAEVDPVPPRRYDRAFPRDLETILMKAMAKDAAHRYATAREFADDLRRFLDDQIIKARRPTVLEHVGRWVRRNSALVATALLGLALSVTMLAASVFLLWREQGKTTAALRSAEDGRREARKAVDTMYTQVAEKWLENQPQLEGVQREFLEEAQRFYDRFSQQTEADPTIRHETALAALRAGDIQRKLGLRPQARSSYRRAIVLLEGLLSESPGSPPLRLELSQSYMTLGFMLEREWPLEAERVHRQAVSIAEGLATEFPLERKYLKSLAQKLNNLGNAVMALGRYHDTLSLYQRGGDIHRELRKRDPDQPQDLYGIAMCQVGIAAIVFDARQLKKAEEYFRDAIKHLELLPDNYKPTMIRHELASCYRTIGKILIARGDREGSKSSLQKSVDLELELVESFPKVPDYRESLAWTYVTFGTHHAAFGQTPEALSMLQAGLLIQEHLNDGATDTTQPCRHYVETEIIFGEILTAAGRVEEARGHFQRGLESLRTLLEEAPDSFQWAGRLARFLVTCPDPQFLDPANAVRLAIKATDLSPEDVVLWTTLGLAYYRTGDWNRAKQALDKTRSLNAEDPIPGFVLAMVSWKAGDKAIAQRLLQENSALAGVDRSHDLWTIRIRDEASRLCVAPSK